GLACLAVDQGHRRRHRPAAAGAEAHGPALSPLAIRARRDGRRGRALVKALVFERSLPRYAAARVAASVVPGAGAKVGPLRLSEIAEPDLPGPGWHRVRPRLAGICGSDLATVDGQSSRYFEPIVSFPFVPGHEVVGELDAGRRVVLEPVLACAARAGEPAWRGRAGGHPRRRG